MDMGNCLLSEKPKPAIHPEDIEIQPDLQALPVPLRPLPDNKKVRTIDLVHTVLVEQRY